ncbi:MAG: MFS transporter [Crocinitomicaceae bacterium]|nr:MFS transporter [Crocinitomicaceae bacterium]
MISSPPERRLWVTLLVASLGYFVDIYDLQLFNIVSKSSLTGIGITDPAVLKANDYLLFLWQMGGMLLGGILWGIIGDRKGRKSILFGSILLYSIANILNAFVTTLDQYSAVRFIAGLGLAGELGAAITLVSEIMHREKRGYGTMIIVTMGALGAVAAVLISRIPWQVGSLQNWQVAYITGGILGLLLLLLRMRTFESSMFEKTKKQPVQKGNFILLFKSRRTFFRYFASILTGLPVWYCIGVLIKFSDKFSLSSEVSGGPIEVPLALMYAYIGLSAGDLLSGLFSQYFRSRKKIIFGYLSATTLLMIVFLYWKNLSVPTYYFLCFMVGCATGYWALFVTMAAEQFGTNIRATVTTTVPNFVRGAVIPITLSYVAIEHCSGNVIAAVIVGITCIGLAFLALLILPETFGKDLDYVEMN